MNWIKKFKKVFFPVPEPEHHFSLPSENIDSSSNEAVSTGEEVKNIFPSIDVNLEYIKVKYNTMINSDIIIREFDLTARNKQYKAFLLFIDGMVNTELINNFVLRPLMLKNDANSFESDQSHVISEAVTNNITIRKVKKFDIIEYISSCLLPQNALVKETEFSEIIAGVNAGNCALFIDTLEIAFNIDVKGFKQRAIDKPENEVVIRGPQEAFTENIRTNTSLLRRIINNENLIMEDIKVGKISRTPCAVCYLKNVANSELVAEVKYRLNNVNIDYLFASGQLEQLIEDNGEYSFPQMIATERPDKAATHLLEGRVAIIVNGAPYVLVAPAVFIDFLTSSEDRNIKFQFANLLKFIRVFAFIITLLLPGLYVAITSFHQEFIPTELLFAIVASRSTVPFSIIFEIIIMELSFELIREAGIRVPSPVGPTIGIIRCFNYWSICC